MTQLARVHALPEPPIPMFEGKEVHATKLKVATSGPLLIDDRAFGVDDVVHIVVEAKITQVHHNVNEATGTLERVHTAKVLGVSVGGPQ